MAALGRPGYITLGHADDLQRAYDPADMQANTFRVLDAAWSAGVRYFDAARSYGRGEEFLGDWLRERGIAPADVVVGSKWGYIYTADWQVNAPTHEIKEHSLPVLRQQWDETQTNLGGYLRLYQIHSATLESGVLNNVEVLTELARLKTNGTAIGLSLSGVGQGDTLRHALDVAIDGVRLFDSVQATYNLLERSLDRALQEAHDAGVSILVKEALANGRLTTRNAAADFMALLTGESARLNVTVDALALAFVLSRPWAQKHTVVLSGAATTDQLVSNMGALTVKWNFAADAALELLAETAEVYWEKRKNLAWN
ncbi:MAG: aldo/keto reductase [Blastochloris sp.]|nr:aldo/keto reductase [Blastochloris sp.]